MARSPGPPRVLAQMHQGYGPHESAASFLGEKQALVFLWHTLLPRIGTLQTHSLHFGSPHEITTTHARDVCETTLELTRQFGICYGGSAMVFHVSLNSALLSALRTFASISSIAPFPQLQARRAIRDIAVNSATQLLAIVEFLRISVHQQHEQRVPGCGENIRTLVVFSGLNSLLTNQPLQTINQVKACLALLAENQQVLLVWISCNNAPPIKPSESRSIYHSSTGAYI